MIQGITGKEGSRALNWMTSTGLQVVAGVTPGKGGQEVEGVPVYDSVQAAKKNHPQTTHTSIYVPPKFVKSAALEAIEAGLEWAHIFAEGVPVRDTLEVISRAKQTQTKVLGPSSIGVTIPSMGSWGSLGGGSLTGFLPATQKAPGVAVISKSGGMANTIAKMLTAADIPQSLVVGIGGDQLLGTTYADLLLDLQQDETTQAVVVIGEIGGAYEEVLAEQITQHNFTKPVIAMITGVFAQTLPKGVSFGHAGAIVSQREGSRDSKMTALKKAGATVVDSPQEIVKQLTASS